MDLEALFAAYGDLYYVMIFVWTFLEGETIVLLSGILTNGGSIGFAPLLFSAWAGSFLGDQLWFLLGRKWGKRIVVKFPRMRPGITRAISLLERWDIAFIMSFRFIYGIRNVSSVAMGMSSLSWGRFAALNFLAAGLWAFCFAGAGHLAGKALSHFVEGAASGLTYGLLGVVVVALCGNALVRRIRARKAVKTA